MDNREHSARRRRRNGAPVWGELPYLRRGLTLDQLVDLEVDVAEEAISSIEAARLRRLINELPVLERRVICWRYGIGCDRLAYREIAIRLGMPQGSIWKIEQHALELLRGGYGEQQAA